MNHCAWSEMKGERAIASINREEYRSGRKVARVGGRGRGDRARSFAFFAQRRRIAIHKNLSANSSAGRAFIKKVAPPSHRQRSRLVNDVEGTRDATSDDFNNDKT